MKSPFVSVIIPMPAISDVLLTENLPSFATQSFKQFEVIILPNNKSVYDAQLQKKYAFLRIVPTHAVTRPAQKRDIGARRAKGDILAFIDDDAYAQKDWLKNAVNIFKKKHVGAVCGPGILPKKALFWESVFDEVLKTTIGSGGFAYRFTRKPARYVDDYPSMNFLIHKKFFKSLGGFNSDYWPGEDSKLCEDLVYKLKQQIYYDPSVTVFHHRRNDPVKYLKQHGNYGFHRGAFFAHGDKNSRRIAYLIPSAFTLYLASVLIFVLVTMPTIFFQSALSLLVVIPLAFYGLMLLFVGIYAYKNTKSLKIASASAIVLFLTHGIYGLQFLNGFFVGKVKKDNIYV